MATAFTKDQEAQQDRLEKMVDSRNDRADTAHSLAEAGSPEDYLSAYAAVNGVDEHAQISQLAYQYYLERGGEHGHHDQDWYKAEQEIRRQRDMRTGKLGAA